jgi:hypothetical protein
MGILADLFGRGAPPAPPAAPLERLLQATAGRMGLLRGGVSDWPLVLAIAVAFPLARLALERTVHDVRLAPANSLSLRGACGTLPVF